MLPDATRLRRDRRGIGVREMTKRCIAAAIAALGCCAIASSSAVAAGTLTVRSTLTGKTVLPHRIHWLGIPSLPESQIREIDFLIDGKVSWVEHHGPYSYGYDGNYLVTSWLTPGFHEFTVTAIAKNGSRASTASRARTRAPSPPPSTLAGTWTRNVTSAEAAGSGRAGTWTLTVNAVGWRILDPTKHGALVDVAYLSSNSLEARGGIATRNHDPHEGNIWCDEPFQPVRYAWSVSDKTLTLALAGPKRCGAESSVWAGEWTRD
jgi:hypothetical protein